MRKVKMSITAITLVVILTGLGYAAWGDNLAISSVVKTGELNVQFVQDNTYKAFRSSEFVVPSSKISGEKAQEFQVSFNNMYPGSWGMFKVKGINSGTVPAKFQDARITFEGDKDTLLPYLTFEAGLTIDSNGDNVPDKTCYFSGMLQDFEYKFNEEIKKLQNVALEPKNSGNFFLGVPYDKAGDIENKGEKDDYVIIKMSPDAPQDVQGKSMAFNLIINFNQSNQ